MAAPLAGPGSSYVVEGIWEFVVRDSRSGEIVEGPFDIELHQDPVSGDITFVDEDDFLITLRRVGKGAGRMIPYELSLFDAASPCNFEVKGMGRLDVVDEEIVIRAQGTDTDCTRFFQEGTFTKQ